MNKLNVIGHCLALGLGVSTFFTSVIIFIITSFEVGNPLESLFWTTYLTQYNYASIRILFGLLVLISSASIYLYLTINRKGNVDSGFSKFFGITFLWIVGLMIASYGAGYLYGLFNQQ
jgi:hypothetical protein